MYSTHHKKESVSTVHVTILRIIAWAIERSAQRMARQKEEELRLATRYRDSGDMGLQKR